MIGNKFFLTPPRIVSSTRDLQLPPKSETIVSLQLCTDTLQGTTGVISPIKSPAYFTSNTLARVNSNTVVAKILNPSSQTVHIGKNKPIANFYILESTPTLRPILKKPGRYPHKHSGTVRIKHQTEIIGDNNCSQANKTPLKPNRRIMSPGELLQHIDLSNSPITVNQKKELTDLILANHDVFGETLSELGASKQYVYPFRMKPDAIPYRAKPYRTNPKHDISWKNR